MKIIFLGLILSLFYVFAFLHGIDFQEKRHPVNPQPFVQVHAITMPVNCYDQLKNAKMIHIKILE
jgi:hypothetical protein